MSESKLLYSTVTVKIIVYKQFFQFVWQLELMNILNDQYPFQNYKRKSILVIYKRSLLKS
jgi:hypothetical protein